MRKFLISSRNFQGAIAVFFKNSGTLDRLDFCEATISAQQIASFLKAIPVMFFSLEDFIRRYQLIAVEATYDVPFDEFWDKYKKKVNRLRCLPVRNKMLAGERVSALNFITKYNRYCERDGRARLDPENYLKRKTWENEY